MQSDKASCPISFPLRGLVWLYLRTKLDYQIYHRHPDIPDTTCVPLGRSGGQSSSMAISIMFEERKVVDMTGNNKLFGNWFPEYVELCGAPFGNTLNLFKVFRQGTCAASIL